MMKHENMRLRCGDIVDATVTRFESYGVFADIGTEEGLIALYDISKSRIPHGSVRFTLGQKIKAVIKERDENGLLRLSHKVLLGTWEENAGRFAEGQTVQGIVRQVEKYGIFVELAPNLFAIANSHDDAAKYTAALESPAFYTQMEQRVIQQRLAKHPKVQEYNAFADRFNAMHTAYKERLDALQAQGERVQNKREEKNAVISEKEHSEMSESLEALKRMKQQADSMKADIDALAKEDRRVKRQPLSVCADVRITRMMPERSKIKAEILRVYFDQPPMEPPQYFITEGHLDRWVYSACGSERTDETVFDGTVQA